MTTILDLCGNTPLVQLKNIISDQQAKISLKLERVNAGGSIKDRPAKYLIEKAEKEGLLKPGGTIIESSSGNFGIACAMIGAAKGYKVIILIDPKTTPTNRALLNVYGAHAIVVTEKDDKGTYHKTRIAMANRLHQEIPNSFWPNQCSNTGNNEAHYQSTAPEILRQCDGKVDALVMAVSTGGQLGGMSRYFSEHSPHTKIVAVDAMGSTIFGGEEHGYLLPGVGLSWTPNNITDLSFIDEIYKIGDEDTFLTCRILAKYEGILAGGSTGATVITALKLAQDWPKDKHIVCIAADNGERYLDTVYNDAWLNQNNICTSRSLAQLQERVNLLSAYSKDPVRNANYKPDLDLELDNIANNIALSQLKALDIQLFDENLMRCASGE